MRALYVKAVANYVLASFLGRTVAVGVVVLKKSLQN